MALLVITGPPGAGKSTVATRLARRRGHTVVVEGDRFFDFLGPDQIPPWHPASHQQNEVVITAAGAATGAYARGGCEVVYDGVLGSWFLPAFTAAVGLDEFDYAVLLPPVQQCVERVAARVEHRFSNAEATRKLHADFAAADVDQRHVLTELPDEVDGVVDAVLAARAAGALRWRRGGATGPQAR